MKNWINQRFLKEKMLTNIAVSETVLVQYNLTALRQSVVVISPIAADRDYFTHIDCGLTSTRGGIAETGSLVLFASLQEPRKLSLVPPVHIAILTMGQLYGSMAEMMQSQQWNKTMPSNLLIISGPSKTADIEQVLAYGVHDPKELLVILVN